MKLFLHKKKRKRQKWCPRLCFTGIISLLDSIRPFVKRCIVGLVLWALARADAMNLLPHTTVNHRV